MRNLDKFIDEALEMAGEEGERKRKFKRQTASSLASSRMAEAERAEAGATKRLGMKEAGLGARLEKEQTFAKPYQEAETRRSLARGGLRRAEAEKLSYDTEFARGSKGTVENILKSQASLRGSQAREAGLGV